MTNKKDITPIPASKKNTDIVEDATILPNDEVVVVAPEEIAVIEDRELTRHDFPPAERPPLQVQDIEIEDIALLDNIVRPEYYGIEELADSMYVQNQLQPVCVRPASKDAEHGKPWELIYGYRRLRAAEYNEWETIRATVRDIPDEFILEVMITENLQRAPMSHIAEARAIRDMISGGLKAVEVAARLGKSKSHISHRLKLLELRPEVMQMVEKGDLGASAGESIAALPAAKQLKVAKKAVSDGLSVSRIEAMVRTNKDPEVDIPDEELLPIDPVVAEDVVDLPYFPVRPDFEKDPLMGMRVDVYMYLRNCMDMEMTEHLRHERGYTWETFWDFVRELTREELVAFKWRLRRRYLESAHRFPTLEPNLREDLGDPAQQSASMADRLALPGLDLLIGEDWWDEDFDE